MSKTKKIPQAPTLPLCGCDSHAHLDFENFADLDAVMQRANEAGVSHFIQVFLHPDAYEKNKERFAPYNTIYYILGIHPTQADEYTSQVQQRIQEIFQKEPRFRGLGEIGLDYYWKKQSKELQQKVFHAQLEQAKQLNVPVIIHSRDAHDDTIAILLEHKMDTHPLLWHCFGGNAQFAQRLLGYGWYLSIPGPVTYPANEELRQALVHIPLERLLVETDCPFLSPVPKRGTPNEPANLAYTIAEMAAVKKMPIEELWKNCGNTARRFFNITE